INIKILFKISFKRCAGRKVLLGIVVLPVVNFTGFIGTIPRCPAALVFCICVQGLIVNGPYIIFILIGDAVFGIQVNEFINLIISFYFLYYIITFADGICIF